MLLLYYCRRLIFSVTFSKCVAHPKAKQEARGQESKSETSTGRIGSGGRDMEYLLSFALLSAREFTPPKLAHSLVQYTVYCTVLY
jgi:hypothetical protein